MRTIGLIQTMVLAGMALAVSAAEQAGPWRQFTHQEITISVEPDNAGGHRAYQVTVLENGLPLSRLAVNRDGMLSNAWKTDLDGDGNFEIVVATDQLDGGSQGGVDIHEWNEFRFESDKLEQVIVSERDAYRGHDQFKVVDGVLQRSFPRFEIQDGAEVPNGETATYEYDPQQRRWMAATP